METCRGELKTIIALSRRYDDNMPAQLNAIGHVAQAMGHNVRDLRMAEYSTADEQALGALSWWPVIILSGRAPKIRELWDMLQGQPWPKACFVETMISGGSDAQLRATRALRSNDLPIMAVAAHGPVADLNPLTRKLSLWKAGTSC